MSLRMALGVVGGAVGFVLGGPGGARWGFMIGSTIGSIIDPGTIKGPSIGDVAQQTSQEGVPRPIVYVRSPPMAGNVIAQSEPRIQKNKQSAKGAPNVVSESVFRTYAVGICEGPCGGVRRVWRNNVLVYDATPVPVLPAEDSAAFLEKARFFLGTYTQDASPDLEAVFGVGTTPAHRGTCYMVMADEDLTDLRGAIPQWTFEVTSATGVLFSTDVLDPWTDDSSDPRDFDGDLLGGYTYQYYLGTGSHGSSEDTLAAAVIAGAAANTPAGGYENAVGFTFSQVGLDNSFLKVSPGYSRDPAERVNLYLAFNRYAPSYYEALVVQSEGTIACGAFLDFTPPIAAVGSARYWWSGEYEWTGIPGVISLAAGGSGVWRLATGTTIATGEVFVNNCGMFPGTAPNNPVAVISPDRFVLVTRQPHKPPGAWTAVSGSFLCLAEYAHGITDVTQYPLNPTIEVGSESDTQAFWEAAYAAALADGDVPPGWVYGVDYPAAISTAWQGQSVSVDETLPLSTVITLICERANVPAALLDLSDLQTTSDYTEPQVHGLMVTNQYAAVEAIRALGQVYLFDLSPADGLLVFVRRGHDSVATVTEDDMVDDDQAIEDDKRDDSITVPRMLHLNYHDVAGGLATDKQTSERAGDRRSIGEASIQTPAILTANEAAQAVVINHKVITENQKGSLRFSLSDKFIRLAVADPIIVQKENTSRRVRIERLEILDGYQKYEVAFDRQSAYTSDVEGIPAAPQTPPPSSIVGPTLIVPLDIPILRDADDAPGLTYYVAVAGLTPAWQGALVELSYDGGANYVDSRTALNSATIGELVEVLADHPQEFPDEVSTLAVRIDTPDVDLEDTDLAGMLNRVNLAAVGNVLEGWELVNFANAGETSAEGRWDLSYLLRGRKDTAAREHPPGDDFVLLERGVLGFVAANLTDLDRTLTFRATSLGAPTSSGTVVSMFYTGQSQTERRPGYVQVVPGVDSNGANVTVSWQGVGRLGGGGAAAHGFRFDRYRVTFDDHVAAPVVIDTEETEVVQSLAGMAAGYPVIDSFLFSTFLPIQKVLEFGGDLYGIYPTSPPSIRRFAASDGTYLGGVALVNPGICTGFLELGGFFYVSVVETAGGGCKVYKLDPADVIIGGVLTPIASLTGSPGDFQGLATDGASLYVTLAYSWQVKKLNTSLSVLATLAVAQAPAACSFNAGNLFVALRGTDEVAVIELAGFTEAARFSCVQFPLDIIATDALVFVQGTHQLGVYDHAGASVFTYDTPTLHSGAPVTQELAYDGARIFRADDAGLVFYSGLGGELSASVPMIDVGFAGGFADDKYFVTGGSQGGQVYGSILLGPTVSVAQLNDLTGAGPAIEVNLP